jgi:DNA mismatch endonuclease, patch repair protein
LTDVHSSAVRSQNMRAIRHKNTTPELIVRRTLHARGFRFRLHDKKLPGTPDLVLPRFNAVIFVHGCFWHGHSCHLFKLPQTRGDFWIGKISGNVRRDEVTQETLQSQGWRIAVVWECSLKGRYRITAEELGDCLSTWLSESQSAFLEVRGSDALPRD